MALQGVQLSVSPRPPTPPAATSIVHGAGSAALRGHELGSTGSSTSSGLGQHAERGLLLSSLVLAGLPVVVASQRRARQRFTSASRRPKVSACRSTSGSGPASERPLLDQFVTAGVKKLEELELGRVRAMSETPSAENKGWAGEPREWAERSSLTQQVSAISQGGPLAQVKQFIAERLAGDYDREEIGKLIQSKIDNNKVMMFSFSTCPFCLKAKDILTDKYGVDFEVYECDLEPEGSAVRAELGRLTGRTSMPSTWLGADKYVGGCNDGGLGGVASLDEAGTLRTLLAERGAFDTPWWQSIMPSNDVEIASLKEQLEKECAKAPKNGIDAPEDLKQRVSKLVLELEQFCPWRPTSANITGNWELLYCDATGSSNGRVGPFVGDVTQTIVDDKKFVNAVELFGALRIALEAEREVIDDGKFKVTFKELSFSLMGQELFRKSLEGEGTWKQRYVDDSLRVMNTPSLFVLKRVSES